MIVEDQWVTADDLKRTLERLGYTISSVVGYGENAVEKAESDMPDLILMDIVLKGEMDGIEAANQIHSRLNIPVIYLTAFDSRSALERAKITEPFGYMIKPFQERELHSTIEMALYKHRVEDEKERLIKDLQTALSKVKELSGLIPICASCKKIRDGKGDWNQIETYIHDHSEADFTHSVCPDCSKKLYPDYSKNKE
jgi:CheY-like chemotaxis protein